MDNLNQVIIVGKFVSINNNHVTIKIISEKNTSLNVNVEISKHIINKLINNCTSNDIIGIKGNIGTDKNNNIKIIANKVSYIQTKKS